MLNNSKTECEKAISRLAPWLLGLIFVAFLFPQLIIFGIFIYFAFGLKIDKAIDNLGLRKCMEDYKKNYGNISSDMKSEPFKDLLKTRKRETINSEIKKECRKPDIYNNNSSNNSITETPLTPYDIKVRSSKIKRVKKTKTKIDKTFKNSSVFDNYESAIDMFDKK